MKRTIRPAVLAVLAFSASMISLLAQDPNPNPQGPPDGPPPGHHGPPPSELFKALDTNHDGVISAEEIANAPAALKTLAGASGQITRESLRPKPPQDDERRNGPSAQSRGPGPEHEGRVHRPPPPDAQDDSAASPDAQASPSPSPRHGPPDGRHHGPPPRDDERQQPQDASASPSVSPAADTPADNDGRRHGPPHHDRLFDALDTNHDGVISADEINAAATSLKKADTNGDGKIDRADMRPPPPPHEPGD